MARIIINVWNDVSHLSLVILMFHVMLCSINLNYYFIFLFFCFRHGTADVIAQLTGVFDGLIERTQMDEKKASRIRRRLGRKKGANYDVLRSGGVRKLAFASR